MTAGIKANVDGSAAIQVGGSDAINISSGLNVGIGTSSPSGRLHVESSSGGLPLYVNSTASAQNARIRLNSTDNASSVSYVMSYSHASLNKQAAMLLGGTGAVGFYVGQTAGAEPTTGTLAQTIDSSGNLLVGRTSGLGSARFVVEQDTTTANPMAVSNPKSAAGSDYSIIFYRNGSIVGSIQTTLSATSYGTSSDYRLKENVQPMADALSKVIALKPCTYQWKSDGSSGQGFIAHELAEVVPDAVSGEKDAVNGDGSINPQGIDTSFLVATLTAAIQEQQQMIETLQAKVAALEGA